MGFLFLLPACLFAADDPALPWITEAFIAPRVTFHTFDSAAAKTKVCYHLFTPEIHDKETNRRFPVLYWLHGSGGLSAGAVQQMSRMFNQAMTDGKMPAMFVVFVNGLPNGMYCDWKSGRAPVETVIIKELIPHIDATQRTIATRQGRIIEGFSMGGYGAARLGFKFPELFCAVSILGAGPLDPKFADTPRANPKTKQRLIQTVYGDLEYFTAVSPWHQAEVNAQSLRTGITIRQIVGDRDETLGNNQKLDAHLTQLGIPHAFKILPGVEHNPMAVFNTLGDSNWAYYRSVLVP